MSTRKYHAIVELLDRDTGQLAKTVKSNVWANNECEAIGQVVQQLRATHGTSLYVIKFPKVFFMKRARL
jgi:hypothetical protein